MDLLVLEVSGLAFASTLGGLVVYFSKVVKNQTPVVPVTLIAALLGGILLGAYSVFLAVPGSGWDWLVAGVVGGMPILIGLGLLWLLSQAKTPIGNIKVKVGDRLLPFETKDHMGRDFNTEDLKGQRTLFKFYRGSWCPYCCAELNMFDAMAPTLEKYGVQVVALSNDTVEEARAHVERDGLSHRLLSDPKLEVVQGYGVEHHRALGADSSEIKTLFGIPMPMSMKFKSMSIPTTLLVDEEGIIRWLDQSDDYRIRASEERILGAISELF